MTNFERLMARRIAHWPAWGVMDTGYHEGFKDDPVPPDWTPPKGGDRMREWLKWRAKMIDVISDTIWPAYDLARSAWPKAKIPHMHEITAADLSILVDLQGENPLLFEQPIQSPVASPNPSTHKDFFVREDGSSMPGEFHMQYDGTLSTPQLADVAETMEAALGSKTGNTAAQFKRELQRPRALQMSLAWGEHSYRHEGAITAYSPAMISGHCLQGLVVAGAVIDRWLTNPDPPPGPSFEAMQQYGTDVGDRRVLAGIHYPSDSLASWIVLLSKADQIYRSKETKKHLWRAIRKSPVYRRIVGFKGSKVYRAGLRALNDLAPAA